MVDTMQQRILLPAPPTKRRKVLQPLAVHPGRLDTSPQIEPDLHQHVAEQDVAAELEAPEALLLNDTMAALHLLKSRFPAEAKVTPFATKAQLYSVLADRTAVDQQLEQLRRANAVRLLQLPSSSDEYAIMLTTDYQAALQRCKQQLVEQQQQQQEKGGSGGSGGSGAGPGQTAPAAASAAVVFDWFGARVLPACTETLITHQELVHLLEGRTGGTRSRAGAACQPAQRGAPMVVTDRHISLLLNHCFLTRHTGGDGYLFSMPNAGAAVRSVAAGRQEVLSLLRRRRHPELLEAELEKRKLQRSVLGVKWHVADMVGSGALLRLPTTVGPLLRVARRGG